MDEHPNIVHTLRDEGKKEKIKNKDKSISPNNKDEYNSLCESSFLPAKHSIEFLRAAVDHSADSIFLINKELMKFVDVNKTACESTGYTRNELLNMGPQDIKPEYTKEELKEKFNSVLHNLNYQGNVLTTVHQRKDGSVFPVEVYLTCLKENNIIIASVRDISIRKENEEKFRSFVENANDIVYSLSLEGIFTYVSPNWAELLGHDVSEVIGKSFAEFVHPDDISKCWSFLEQVVSTKQKQQGVRYRVKHSNGQYMWHTSNASPLLDEKGNVKSYVGIARDVTEFKKAEDELRRSNERFKALFDNANDAIFLLKINGEIIDINKRAIELLGFDKNEMVLRDIFSLHPKKERSKAKEAFLQTKEKGYSRFESRFLRKDESEIFVDISSSFIDRENGIIQGVARDITQWKRLERELKESKKKFQYLFHSLKDGVFVHQLLPNDRPGTFIQTNKAASSMLGYSKDEFKTMSPYDLDDPHYGKEYIPQALQQLQDRGEAVFEAIQVRKDGSKLPVEVNSNIVNFNGKPHIISVTRDITKRKQIEAKRNEYQQILASTLESVDSLLIVIDKNHRVVLCNWKDHEWVPEEQRQKRPFCYKVLKNFDRPCDYCPPVNTFEDGKTRFYEDRNPIDGSFKEISVIPICDEQNHVEYVLENVRDVTYQKKAESKLKELNKNLEEKVEQRTKRIKHLLDQKDEFINQLGHDLKNPLGPFLQLLPILKDHVSDEKGKQIIEVLDRNANYMRNLVKKTIDLAKLNSSKTNFTFEDVSLGDLVEEVIAVNDSKFNDQEIAVENNIPFDCIVYVDELHIQEVFTNLFNNAVKYTDGPGRIIVNAKLVNDSVLVSIKDSGIGIAMDQIDHLFDEYYKADHSRHDFESSGLGLPICKRIVERHGGRIWAESPGIGKGSTFYFTLPFNHPDQS